MVPALGLALPAPASLNYAALLELQQTDPDGYALLESLYKAGNVPISSFIGQLQSLAPLGTASESTLIRT
jgi:hypothetical protein